MNFTHFGSQTKKSFKTTRIFTLSDEPLLQRNTAETLMKPVLFAHAENHCKPLIKPVLFDGLNAGHESPESVKNQWENLHSCTFAKTTFPRIDQNPYKTLLKCTFLRGESKTQ